MRRLACLLLFFVFFAPVVAIAAPEDLAILRVTPDGEGAAAARQIVIQFNRAVVPLGEMKVDAAKLPVSISPAADCEWRWLNTSALSCNLAEKAALRPATRYTVNIEPGIKAEDGATIARTFKHEFVTERPDARYGWVKGWQDAGRPVAGMSFNMPVTRESVARSLYFAWGPNNAYTARVDVMPDSRNPYKGETANARSSWLLVPQGDIPADTEVRVMLRPGLQTPEGNEEGASEREASSLRTFPAPVFMGARCTPAGRDSEPVLMTQAKMAQTKCDPMRPIALVFSAPVLNSVAKRELVFTPRLSLDAENVWGNSDWPRTEGNGHSANRTYDLHLPQGLKANSAYRIATRGEAGLFTRLRGWLARVFGARPTGGLRDEFGRAMPAIDYTIHTDNRSPNYVLPYRDAVLESATDSDVPFYVNNLASVTFDYSRIGLDGVQNGLSATQKIPEVRNLQFAVPVGLREMLGGKSGAVFGRFTVDPQVDRGSWKPRLFAQVTPYQAHVKLGHFSSLAWITDMQSGQPVTGARVSIYRDRLTAMAGMKTALAQGQTDDSGLARLAGTDTLDPDLKITGSWREEDEALFLRVDKDGEMALLPLNNDYVVDSYRLVGESVWPDRKRLYGHMKAWGTTAQGVYRAGDTIQYKLYVRNQNDRQLTPPPREGYSLKITDPTGKVVHEVKDVALDRFGAYAGSFATPANAVTGFYAFGLTANFAKVDSYGENLEEPLSFQPMRVLVSDFTPAPFRVSGQLNGKAFGPGQKIESETLARLHSGGGYGDAPVRVTAMLETRAFAPKDGPATGFVFGSDDGTGRQREVFQKIDVLDAKGDFRADFSVTTPKIYFGRLTVESAVQDERGKYITTQADADYYGVDRFVGVKTLQWMHKAGEKAEIAWIVVDPAGKPAAGSKVSVAIEKLETKAARVKGAGNAYMTEYTNTWKAVAHCKGVSAAESSPCGFTPESAGSYRAVATVRDTKGVEHRSETGLYATGTGRVVWQEPADASLEIVPEKSAYKAGETARYMVKNPFPDAMALVTIERYGVIDSFVQKLEGAAPVISFEVKPDYIPGFYLSVVAFSPRVDKPVENQVDLGKPSYRIGYVTVPVADEHKQIDVTVESDREEYKPRETVKLSLSAKPKTDAGKEPVELAIVVLDEAIFDLIAGGLEYFDPYAGFYGLDGLDLRNYSLLTRLVGRQKFEKKGANPGGDGGADLAMRNLFKFVAYWNPSVPVDAQGRAHVEFAVPDNLTGWRVLALAATPSDRLGLGQGNFKVNQPVEIRPVMPNQVLEGDSFDAGFSVMNRTGETRDIAVAIAATDDAAANTPVEKTITLEPYKRATVTMPVTAGALPLDGTVGKGKITFTVTARSGDEGDKTEHAVDVGRKRHVETAADYGATDRDNAEVSLAIPQDIYPDSSRIAVVAAPSVIGDVAGAFAYMRDYPYLCWEQQLTKGVMALHYANLRAYAPAMEWPEAETLPQKILETAGSFQAPNGGMAYFLPRDQYADPYLGAYTALAFAWMRKSGLTPPAAVEKKLHEYLQNLLKQESFPDGYDGGMASSVRAVVLAALADGGAVTLADIERFRPHLAQMNLLGRAHFLQAALKVEGGKPAADEAARLIFNRANETGGKIMFSEELGDGYGRMLASPLRENCAVLSALVAYGEKSGQTPVKLARMIAQSRGSRTHWENTQENIFCMNALTDYARVYERDRPDMRVTVGLDGETFGRASFAAVTDAPVRMERPMQAQDEGRKARVMIERDGRGMLYYATQMTFAPKASAREPVNAGMTVRREYSVERDGKWQLLQSPMTLKPSEVVRVDIYLSLPAARNFVVVDDPVPGGLETVNRNLATASGVDADKGAFKAADGSAWFDHDWTGFGAGFWSFYHRELRHDAARFFADYLPAGNYHLSYAAQAVATGEFSLMPVTALEMYDPDVFAKGVEEKLVVQAVQ